MFRIATNNSFQVYTADENGARMWIDVAAEGVTPALATNYCCIATIDYE